MKRAAFAVALLHVSCGPAHSPGDIASRGAREARTLGCLDMGLSVSFREDTNVKCFLLNVALGNRCGREVPVDLGAMAIDATDDQGRAHRVRAYDPRAEIARVHIEPYGRGEERVCLVPAVASAAFTPSRICADVSRVTDAPPDGDARLCFRDAGRDGWLPTGER